MMSLTLTLKTAKAFLRNRKLLETFGASLDSVLFTYLYGKPTDMEAIELLIAANPDINRNIRVPYERNGEHKMMVCKLIKAIIASGVYTVDELVTRFDSKMLKKAAHSVAVDVDRFDGRSHHGLELMTRLGVKFSEVRTSDVRRLRDVLKYGARPGRQPPEDVGPRVKAVMSYARQNGIQVCDLTYIMMPAEIVKAMAEELGGEPMPQYNTGGMPALYSVAAAIWLNNRYGSVYAAYLDDERYFGRHVDDVWFRELVYKVVDKFGAEIAFNTYCHAQAVKIYNEVTVNGLDKPQDTI